MVEVPARLTEITLGRAEKEGRAWIDSLPALVDEFLERWKCRPAGPVTHGHVGIVVPVRRLDGTPAALKISYPHPGNRPEPVALAAWGGHGAVHLLERDDASFAMLLEWAEPQSLHTLSDSIEAVTIAGSLTRRLAVEAPDTALPLTMLAEEWVEVIGRSEFVRQLLPRPVVDLALETARNLATVQPNLLVHGDMNFGNVLRSSREPWLAIDPKGHSGDPAYDSVRLLRDRWPQMVAEGDLKGSLVRQLTAWSEAAEMDRERVMRWNQACASTTWPTAIRSTTSLRGRTEGIRPPPTH